MTVNSYLQGRANNLVIRETEKEKILKSVDTIKSRLSSYFSSDLSDALLFGSYTRGDNPPSLSRLALRHRHHGSIQERLWVQTANLPG